MAGVQDGRVVQRGGSIRLELRGMGALHRLQEQLRDRRVRAAARRVLVRERKIETVTFMLNRQALTAGVLVVCGAPEESPLGPVYVTIESKELDKVIDWLTTYDLARPPP